MSFEDKVKEWVKYDDKIREYNEIIKDLREKKSMLQKDITVYADENNLLHATIQISDGKLKFNKKKTTSPLSLKYIQKCLESCISNEDDIAKIMSIIKENRESNYVDEIRRNFD
mgnify:CR=1 FL=1